MSEDESTNATGNGVSSAAEETEESDIEERDPEAADESAAADGVRDSDADAVPSEDIEEVADRVREYDDDLAGKVGSIAETARRRDQTVQNQQDELADLEERIDEQAETIHELQERIEAREETIEEYEQELEDKAETLEERNDRIDELKSHLKRKQADFQNYKKRAKKRQEQLKSRATEDLVLRIVGVRDNLKRALDEESQDSEDLRDGIEMTLQEFDRVLADENVEEIDPDPGTEIDPQRHEVMAQVDSDRPEGTVEDVFTPGYEMAEKVIQSAQVTVSNGELADESDDEPEAEDDDEDTAEETIELGGDVADSEADDEAATEEEADDEDAMSDWEDEANWGADAETTTSSAEETDDRSR